MYVFDGSFDVSIDGADLGVRITCLYVENVSRHRDLDSEDRDILDQAGQHVRTVLLWRSAWRRVVSEKVNSQSARLGIVSHNRLDIGRSVDGDSRIGLEQSEQIVEQDAVFDDGMLAGARIVGRCRARNDHSLANPVHQDSRPHRFTSTHRPLGAHLALLLAVRSSGCEEVSESVGRRRFVDRGRTFDQEFPIGTQLCGECAGELRKLRRRINADPIVIRFETPGDVRSDQLRDGRGSQGFTHRIELTGLAGDQQFAALFDVVAK